MIAGGLLLGARLALAQVTVTLPAITGEEGTSGVIPITVENLTGQNVLSYQFTLTYNPAVVQITDAMEEGTLSDGNAAIINTTVPGQVTVSYASSSPLTGSGTLLNLAANFLGRGNSALTLTSFLFNEGVPAAVISNGSVVIPQIAFRLPADTTGGVGEAITLPVTTDDDLTGQGVLSYEFTVTYNPAVIMITGVDTEGTLSADFSVQVNTSIPGQIRVAAAGSTPLAGMGTLINLTGQLVGEGSSALTFTSFQLNEGTPTSGGVTGNVTVGGNLAPTFTATLPADTTITEGDSLSFEFVAMDPEGEPLTLTLVNGDTTGVTFTSTGNGRARFTFAPGMTAAGMYTFTVRASDGARSTDYTFTVNVANLVFTFTAPLSGVHEGTYATLSATGTMTLDPNTPVATTASGLVTVTLDNMMLTVNGSFMDLMAPYTVSHIHWGPPGVSGPVAVDLPVTLSEGNRSGTFNAGPFNLAAPGVVRNGTPEQFVAFLMAGDTYVNVHSSAHPPGEIRGQLLSGANTPPAASALTSPTNNQVFELTGDQTANLFTVSFSPVTDPEGDDVYYLYQVSLTSTFTDVIATVPSPAPVALPVTVGQALEQFQFYSPVDTLDARLTTYHRIITSDGANWTAGAVTAVVLERGTFVGTEDGSIPGKFALLGNYPNPFNPSTSIRFDLPETAEVSVQLVDVLGRVVLTTPAQTMTAGSARTLQIDGATLASGTYLYRITARGANATSVATGKMLLVK